MSRVGLSLKYRPVVFEDLVGQGVNQRYFTSLIKNGQAGRNVILHGAYGSSKTTTARIYARALNCENPTGYGSPCNECKSCKEFLSGTYPDYREEDGASNGGVEGVKKLADLARTPPMWGKWRVLVIDECQGLSKQAWDSLLKLVEEPPPWLVFIFTTTEFGKVQEAIRSRCQCLEVRLLSMDDSLSVLSRVCDAEGIEWDAGGLKIVSQVSKGHPRDLLKNLEQVSWLGSGVTESVCKEVFNLGWHEDVFKVFKLLSKKDSDFNQILYFCRGLGWGGKELWERLRNFCVHLHYKFGVRVGVSVDVGFDLLNAQELREVWDALVAYRGVGGSETLGVVLDIFGETPPVCSISSELFLWRFIQVLKPHAKLIGVEANAVKVSAPRGRKFVTKGSVGDRGLNQVETPSYIPPVVNPVVGEKPLVVENNSGVNSGVVEKPLGVVESPIIRDTGVKRVFPHNLLKLGFTPMDSTGLVVHWR